MNAPYYADESVQLYHGDCLDILRSDILGYEHSLGYFPPLIPGSSIDSVVTDPPYGLEFMGKEWDGANGFRRSLNPADVERDNPFGRTSKTSPEYRAGQTFGLWCLAWSEECLRVLKPGGHMLAFGGTRTSHRLACAIEDAGFEIRDSIAYLHATGGQQTDILTEWRKWTVSTRYAGVRFSDAPPGGSAPEPVLLATSLENSPASAIIAGLNSNEARHTDADNWRSALSSAGASTTASKALVTIAGHPPGSRGPTPDTTASSAHSGAWDWLDANIMARLKAGTALRIWLGSKPSTKPAATAALCAALTDDLKLITCAQSETFQSYDTTSQMVCVSATTVTTTAYTAAHLISFTAATLASQGGDATESQSGPLAWVYGSGFP